MPYLKDTPSSNSTRSPELDADPMLLHAISSVDPMDDADEDLEADAPLADSEWIGSDWRILSCVPM
jgi:hypothetical protein